MSHALAAWLVSISTWPEPAQWALKGCLLLTLGVAVSLVLARLKLSADVRHRAWACTLGSALVLPVLAAALPGWTPTWTAPPALDAFVAARPAIVAAATNEAVAELPAIATVAAVTAPQTFEESAAVPASTPVAVPVPLNWSRLLLNVWLVGAAVALVPVIGGMLSLARLGRRARSTSSPKALAAFEHASRDLGVRRRVRLWTSDERSMPMTWGWLRPVVLLPADANSWTEERLHAVLCHELAHVERRDPLVRLIAQAARATYWYFPLAHLALKRLERDQEFACDDRAVLAGQRPVEYAKHLLAVASARPAPRWAPSAALAMARPSRLEQRLRALFDSQQSRELGARRGRLAAFLVTALGCMTLATVHPQLMQAEQPTAKQEATPEQVDFDQLRARLLERYISKPDERKLLGGAIQGMLQALDDPHSSYLPPADWSELQAHVQGNLAGVGVAIKSDQGKVFIDQMLPGSAAEKAGVAAGDQLISVDGKAVDAGNIRAVAQAVRGEAGSAVVLRIIRPGQAERDLTVVRAALALARNAVQGFARQPNGDWQYWIDPEHKIAFVSIREFTPGTAAEVRTTLTKLKEEGLHGLLLDLRHCPGGLPDEALDVARLFVKEGDVLTTVRTRGEETKVFKADGDGVLRGLPLVVLIDQGTASAAELLAGALDEKAGAALVGTRTYGKGSIQELASLGEGLGGVRLTVGEYRLPSGRAVQRTDDSPNWGIDPTFYNYVPIEPAQMAAVQEAILRGRAAAASPADGSDPQLAAGLKALQTRLKSGHFAAVGKPVPEIQTSSAERLKAVEARRTELLSQIKQLNDELEKLQAAK